MATQIDPLTGKPKVLKPGDALSAALLGTADVGNLPIDSVTGLPIQGSTLRGTADIGNLPMDINTGLPIRGGNVAPTFDQTGAMIKSPGLGEAASPPDLRRGVRGFTQEEFSRFSEPVFDAARGQFFNRLRSDVFVPRTEGESRIDSRLIGGDRQDITGPQIGGPGDLISPGQPSGRSQNRGINFSDIVGGLIAGAKTVFDRDQQPTQQPPQPPPPPPTTPVLNPTIGPVEPAPSIDDVIEPDFDPRQTGEKRVSGTEGLPPGIAEVLSQLLKEKDDEPTDGESPGLGNQIGPPQTRSLPGDSGLNQTIGTSLPVIQSILKGITGIGAAAPAAEAGALATGASTLGSIATAIAGPLGVIAPPIIEGILNKGESTRIRKGGEQQLDSIFSNVFSQVGLDSSLVDSGKEHIQTLIPDTIRAGKMPEHLIQFGPAADIIGSLMITKGGGVLSTHGGGVANALVGNLIRTNASPEQASQAMQSFVNQITGATDFQGVMSQFLSPENLANSMGSLTFESGVTGLINEGQGGTPFGDDFYRNNRRDTTPEAVAYTQGNIAKSIQSLGQLYGADPAEVQAMVNQALPQVESTIIQQIRDNRIKRLQKEVVDIPDSTLKTLRRRLGKDFAKKDKLSQSDYEQLYDIVYAESPEIGGRRVNIERVMSKI